MQLSGRLGFHLTDIFDAHRVPLADPATVLSGENTQDEALKNTENYIVSFRFLISRVNIMREMAVICSLMLKFHCGIFSLHCGIFLCRVDNNTIYS